MNPSFVNHMMVESFFIACISVKLA